ncbi:MAG: hypothetical protein CMF22_06855 [Idiomarinaceae bacterium]|nr:hypothetical protein [Idiomarinaceae bacterium]
MPRILIALATLMFLVGCQATPPRDPLWTPVSDAAGFTLATSWPGPAQQELVLIEWSHPEQDQHSLQVSSARSAKGLTMVGLSPLGQELWRAALDASGRFSSTGVAPFDEPRLVKQMLATMQLVNWPIADLQPRLHGAKLLATKQGRVIHSASQELLWELTQQGDTLVVEHHAFNYRIELRQLQLEMLEFPTQQGGQ